MISRANKPIAVLISVSEYEDKVLKKNREKRLQELAGKLNCNFITADSKLYEKAREMKE